MGICYSVIDKEEQEDKLQTIPVIEQSVEKVEKQSYQLTDFQFLRILGKGVFGKVMLGEHIQTKQLFAIKIIDKSRIHDQSFISSEQAILQQSQNPFIIKLFFVFENERSLYLGTEFVNGGELFIHLKQNVLFSEERTRFYAAELILALQYLHQNGVIYRDLKPENILLDKLGHIKLTDFGLSKFKFQDVTYTTCGTPEYVAPEIIMEQGYNEAVDWYSLGILIHEMLSGFPPFYSKDKSMMIDKRLSEPIQFPKYFSANACDLIRSLTEVEASSRLGSRGAEEIMKHPFFEEINFEMVMNRQIEPPFRPLLSGQLDLRYFDPRFLELPIEF